MGRLAIIEEEGGGGGGNKPPEPPSSEPKSSDSSTSSTSTSRMKQGGGISDESGYYEGDELRDDSIEIVYDRHNQSRIPNSAASNNTNAATSNVSITPLATNAPQVSNGKSY